MKRAHTTAVAILRAIAPKSLPWFLSIPLVGAPLNLVADASSDTNELSLEQLINIKVTTVSKKETSLESSPAAVTVITQDDIRRLGIETIPDALRLVPGMEVAQINSHEWAVSSRGFNDQFANKLLVLVNGRAVYTPAFGGVYWDVQDLPMADIDRIEVIRGPGAALWGANAVNGVVNIITKSAKDTQGGLVSVTGGTWDQPSITAQYGGQLTTNLYYRTYVTYFNRDSFEEPNGTSASDAWESIRGGTRFDWQPSERNQLTLEGDYYYEQLGENVDVPSVVSPYWQSNNITDHDAGGNILSRWTRAISDTSQLSVQAYDDYLSEQEATATGRQNTFDLEAQHRFSILDWNDIVWGANYRILSLDNPPNEYITYSSARLNDQLGGGFLQDEITIVPGVLHFTIGTKLEEDSESGFEYEPDARLAWTPTSRQTVWASVSRAVQTPAIFNLHAQVNETFVPSGPPLFPGPTIVAIAPNSALKSTSLMAYELGYRIEPFERLSLDVAAFYNDYDDLLSYNYGTPFPEGAQLIYPVTTANSGSADTYGGEVSAQWQPLSRWRLIASYSLLKEVKYSGATLLENDPEQQAQIRSCLDITPNLELNGMVSYVDRIDFQNINQKVTIPSYVRLDVALVWHPAQSWELGIWGENLLQAKHSEFASDTTTLQVEVPRAIMGRITWRF